MISRIIFILVFTTYTSAFNTGKLSPFAILSKPECQANKIYQKDDVTCFCNKFGRWPHKNCSLVFSEQVTCKPNSFVEVDCNICRCSETGTIKKELCTHHICPEDTNDKIVFRRFSTQAKCNVNSWYVISPCRLCYCLTKDNLLCAAKSNPKQVLVGKYNVTECGPEWLNDINRLLSSVNPLRLGEQREKSVRPTYQADAEALGSQVIVGAQMIPKEEAPIDSPQTLNLNQENFGDKKVNIARNDDRSDQDSSSESDSDEKVEGKSIARITGNTIMPFENDGENDSKNSFEVETDKRQTEEEQINESDNKKQSEEKDESRETEPTIDIVNVQKIVQNNIEKESDGSSLKLNFPEMLGKVFNFGIRKSMVTITDSNCLPGSTLTVECNACFCLTNGKLLCTKKICK